MTQVYLAGGTIQPIPDVTGYYYSEMFFAK